MIRTPGRALCCLLLLFFVPVRPSHGFIMGYRDIFSLLEESHVVVLARIERVSEAKVAIHSANLMVREYGVSVLYTFKGGDTNGISETERVWQGGIDRGRDALYRPGEVALLFLKLSEFTERLHVLSQSRRHRCEDFVIPSSIAERFLKRMKGRTSAVSHGEGSWSWSAREAIFEIKELLLFCARDHEFFRSSYSMEVAYLQDKSFDPVGRLAEIVGHDWRDELVRQMGPVDENARKQKLAEELEPILESHIRPGELAAIVLALRKRHRIGDHEREFDWGWLLDRCRKDLASDDKQSRYRAINTLSMIGPAAKPLLPLLLEKLFTHPDEMARRIIAGMLVRVDSHSQDVLRALVRALEDRSAWVRASAAESVEIMKEPPKTLIRPLIGALKDKDDGVRLGAAKGLRRFGPRASEAIPALIEALDDETDHVRTVSTQALGRMGGAAEEAIPALTRMLEGEDRYDHREAARALDKIRQGE